MNPGQRLILGLKEPSLSNYSKNILKNKEIGGIILFDHNGTDIEQLKSMIAESIEVCSTMPFIAIDYEGGRVSRLRNFFQPRKGVPPIAQPTEYIDKLENLKSDCREAGDDFYNIGINVNFAPVADLTYQPINQALENRTFSADPSETTDYCLTFLSGFEESNIICCLKHFPGLGSAINDPHESVAVSCIVRDRILSSDIVPFKAGIKAGVKMIMTTHLKMTEIDSEIATFSFKTTELARELGFEGILISDDLSMGAVKNDSTLPENVLKTLSSGHDMALICHDHDQHEEVIEYLEQNIPELESHGHSKSLERIGNVKKSLVKKYS